MRIPHLIFAPTVQAPAAGRAAFTAIELLVVIGMMMAVMAMATPPVIGAMRRGAVQSAASDLESCWRQARALAMSHPLPEEDEADAPAKHYGIVMVQRTSGTAYAAVIFDNRAAQEISADPEHAVLRRDRDAASDSDAANPPVAKMIFNRGVRLASASNGEAPDTGERVLVVYAQYRSGVPIDASDVASGHGSTAPPIGLGLPGRAELGIPGSPVSTELRLQTPDYQTAIRHRGYAVGVALYPVGLVAAQAL